VVASVFASVSDTATPQGVLAIAPRRPMDIAELSARPGPVLVLVDVADPGNAGTLIRTAEAAGCAGVVVCGSTTDPFGPKSVRAAAGSVVRLPVAEVDEVGDVISALTGRTIVGTVVGGGVAPESVDLSAPVALLIGSEAHGLSADVVARCDSLVTIPMAPTVESINAATAGAVVLFEAARQRRDR
jgi:RNA methyltransferase, TrmH family